MALAARTFKGCIPLVEVGQAGALAKVTPVLAKAAFD